MQRKSILTLSVLCAAFCLMTVFISCGKKGDPVPLAVVKAGTTGDLQGEVKDGVLFLSFTIPAGLAGKKEEDHTEKAEIGSFRVFKGCGVCIGALEPYRTIDLEEKKGYTIVGNRLYFYDDDLLAGQEYAYKVYPVSKSGTRGEASNPFVVRWEEPPGRPSGLRAAPGDARVEIRWEAEEGYLYNIYRHDEGVYPLFPLNRRPMATSFYIDTNLENGRTYTYEARKVKELPVGFREGEGVKISATPEDKTPPNAPTGVKAERKGAVIVVAWAENAERDLAGYNVYRVMGSSSVKLNRVLITEKTFHDTTPPDFRFIAYYVTAVDTAGNESGSSRESIVMTQE